MAGKGVAFFAAMAALGGGTASAKCSVENFGLLAVSMSGAKPITEAEINGHPVRFMVDSGAFYSLLGPATARELKLVTTPMAPNFELRGIGGGARAELTRIDELKLANVPLKGITFIVGGSDTGVAGVIGQNILGLRDVEYDLQHGAVRLMQPKECADTSLAYWAGDKPVSMLPIEKMDERNRHTIATVLVNGVKLRALFDTGAGISAITPQAARKVGVKTDDPGVREAGYVHGLGGKQVPVYRATFDDIDVGGEKLRKVNLNIQELGGDIDMLVGVDFFLAHRVYVSNAVQKMFFTYDGGPVFGVSPTRAVTAEGNTIALTDTGAEPTDAAGFSARGTAFATKRDYASALADLNRAVELAPTNGRYVFQRSQIRLALQQRPLAIEDLTTAKTLAPTDPEILLAHAQMELSRRNMRGAAEDARAADAILAPEAQSRLSLAQVYGSTGNHEAALANFDGWLRYHGGDAMRPVAFNGRCFSRAVLNRDLDKALSDCNNAVKLQPNMAAYFDSRGLVHLRRGENEAAITDYNAALSLAPNRPMARYARSLAEDKLGQQDAAQKDRAAALAIDPRIADAAAQMGVR